MRIVLVLTLLLSGAASAQATPESFCYDPYGTEVQGEFKAKQALVIVNYLEQPRGEAVQAEWLFDEATQTSLCEIWIRIPDQILGDPDMDGIGHEVLHCILGDFHPDTPHE